MPFNRRRFLALLAVANFLSPFRQLLAASVSSLQTPAEPIDRQCFGAWIETLMPADERSPGAGELGVPLRIVGKAAMNRGYQQTIEAGCRWLDTRAREFDGRNFASLIEAGRAAVASLAESAAPGSIPRLFFERTLDDTFLYYYARRESWVMLGYRGPPQPLGFMDHTQPPQA